MKITAQRRYDMNKVESCLLWAVIVGVVIVTMMAKVA